MAGTDYNRENIYNYLDIIDVRTKSRIKTVSLGENLERVGGVASFIWPYLAYTQYSNYDRPSLFLYNFETGAIKLVADNVSATMGLSTKGRHIIYDKKVYNIESSQIVYSLEEYEPIFFDDTRNAAVANYATDYGRKSWTLVINIMTGQIDTLKSGFLYGWLCGFGKYVVFKESVPFTTLPWGYRVYYCTVDSLIAEGLKYNQINDEFDLIGNADIDPLSGVFVSCWDKLMLWGHFQNNQIDTIFQIQ